MQNIIFEFIKSWACTKGTNSTDTLLQWVERLNKTTYVQIHKTVIHPDDFWHISSNTGYIENTHGSFFKVVGFQKFNNGNVVLEQPMIQQSEIGYLGILCKKIDGVLHFLMQAKIEPGNINKIQISPTIQATKSNFTRQHGGKVPSYLDYFVNAKKYNIVVDQIQSEQSMRFIGKRNRNIIIEVNEEITVLPSHMWMTLGQIKLLMKHNNLVNMDTRTVLSCIPFSFYTPMEHEAVEDYFKDKAMYRSIFNNAEIDDITQIYHYINNYKMFDFSQTKLLPLYDLRSWDVRDNGIFCKCPHNFSVIYCDIEVEGREVQKWKQPLFEASGIATFGLFTAVFNGIRKFLVKCIPEAGCFDKIEIGPTVQKEFIENTLDDIVMQKFFEHMEKGDGILYNVILSEEGGRFYHEQNHNVIIEIEGNELSVLPEEYFWTDFKTLNTLVQVNNCLNIQLRNLLSLLEI